MSKRKPVETIWWAGYMAGVACIVLGGEAKAILTGTPACGDATCNHPWYTIPAALLLLWYVSRKTKRAEQEIAATTFEMVEPSPRSHHSGGKAFGR